LLRTSLSVDRSEGDMLVMAT